MLSYLAIKHHLSPVGLICVLCWLDVKQQVNRLEITPDKQYLAVAGNPHIRLFDIHSTRPDHMGQFDGHTNNVTAIGFQKDRKWSPTISHTHTRTHTHTDTYKQYATLSADCLY